jgi:hypothetical protein
MTRSLFPVLRIMPFRLSVPLCAFFLLSCAKQGFPPGGPEDKTPPSLVSTIPATRATNIERDSRLIFEFSEPMDEESVENNFFIVPIPREWPSFSWKNGGRTLTVRSADPLADNATYVVSIGAKAQDRNRNGLQSSLMLTFSTGTVLEDKRIGGIVIPVGFLGEKPEKVSQIDVVAFRIDGMDDIPDPRNDIPDYVTQTGAEGGYELAGLSRGKYRLFAIGDNDRDGFYTENEDMIGIASRDILLSESDSLAHAPALMIGMRYRSDIQLTSARAPDNRRVELFFDREIVTDGFSLEIPGLEIAQWFVNPSNPKMVTMMTSVQENGKRYAIPRITAADPDGNKMGAFDIVPFFDGTAAADTAKLVITGKKPRLVVLPDERIELTFNRALALPDGRNGIVSSDDRLSLAVDRTAPDRLTLSPVEKWRYGTEYVILLNSDALTGYAGNTLPAESARMTIRTAPADTLSSIAGTLADTGGNGPYRILVKALADGSFREVFLKSAGAWESGPLLPGKYVLYVHCDSDSNGVVGRGSVVPFSFAEQVAAYPDTIALEPRWPANDIKLTIQ